MTQPSPHDPVTVGDLAAERRRLILKGLGKGGAAVVALSPLAVHAGGTHKVANSSLPGGFGYCSVSGFQSAAISGSPAPTVCSAYAPSHFLQTENLSYQSLVDTYAGGGAVTKSKLKTALNAKYFGGSDVIKGHQVQNFLLATPPLPLVVSGRNLCILPGSLSGTGLALQPKAFPSGITNSLIPFNSIFTNSSSTLTLLQVLYEGVLSSSPSSAKCYFLSAYLTVLSSTPPTLPVGFDGPYVISRYTGDAAALSGTTAYNFFKAVCVSP